jgi:hypothetical protein
MAEVNAIEELSPSYLGETRIALSCTTEASLLLAHHPIQVNVDVTAAIPDGVVLPLELIVQGPSPSSYQRKVFSRTVPVAIVFTPREGGLHMVRLAEVAHNKWWGSTKIAIAGDQLEVSRPM